MARDEMTRHCRQHTNVDNRRDSSHHVMNNDYKQHDAARRRRHFALLPATLMLMPLRCYAPPLLRRYAAADAFNDKAIVILYTTEGAMASALRHGDTRATLLPLLRVIADEIKESRNNSMSGNTTAAFFARDISGHAAGYNHE